MPTEERVRRHGRHPDPKKRLCGENDGAREEFYSSKYYFQKKDSESNEGNCMEKI